MYYSVGDQEERFHYTYISELRDSQVRAGAAYLTDIAEACAEHYHYEKDGMSSSWPMTFVLYGTEDGPAVGRFEVEREVVASFSALAITEGGSNEAAG